MSELDEMTYREVQIPRNRDSLGAALSGWEERISEWKDAEDAHAEAEATFKAYEASMKAFLMRSQKMSATAAETYMRENKDFQVPGQRGDWEERFLMVSKAKIEAEEKKRRLRLAEARWETERSREASLRQVR